MLRLVLLFCFGQNMLHLLPLFINFFREVLLTLQELLQCTLLAIMTVVDARPKRAILKLFLFLLYLFLFEFEFTFFLLFLQ
jgi:hypothetical protein